MNHRPSIDITVWSNAERTAVGGIISRDRGRVPYGAV